MKEREQSNSIAHGIAMETTRGDIEGNRHGEASTRITTTALDKQTAAQILVEHLFSDNDAQIPGIDYAVRYKLAEEFVGGDIVDVYHFDNNSVALTIADISGKGSRAAVHTALVKFRITGALKSRFDARGRNEVA